MDSHTPPPHTDAPDHDEAGPGRLPLYMRIAADLRLRIAQGDPPVGGLLPGEDELGRRYGASRYTVRAALTLLVEWGVLLRRNGARSKVIAQQPPPAFTQTIADLSELLSYPADTTRQNLSAECIPADAALAALLGCEPGRRWFRIAALRRSSTHPRPLAWVEIYLLPEYAAVADRPDHQRLHVFDQVERQFGESISRARVEMLPSRIPAEIAAPLEVEPDSPALTVIRRFFGNGGRMFELTRSTHPEGRYVFSMELERRRQE